MSRSCMVDYSVTVLHREARNEETRIDINSRLYFYTEVDRHR